MHLFSSPFLARFILFMIVFHAPAFSWASNYNQLVRELIREKVETAQQTKGAIQAGTDQLLSRNLLPRFYEARGYKTIWIEESGLSAEAAEVIRIIENAAYKGLNPQDYHLKALQETMSSLKKNADSKQLLDVRALTSLELLLTDAYLTYGAHLFYGKVNPETTQPEWKAERKNKEIELEQYLEQAYQKKSLSKDLEKLSPQQVEYRKLKRALRHYKQIAEEIGEIEPIPAGPKIQKGDQDPRIPAIRTRLVHTRDLQQKENHSELYDEELEKVIKKFQARHGLATDGVIGAGTLNALNIPLQERIRKIEINLERWRWLPENLGKEYIMVNIPNFRLNVIDTDSVSLNLTAIVGKTHRKTPVFSARMTYMVINPTWTVPPTILENDILPELRKNTDYLKKKNIKVLRANGTEVDPATVDWTKIRASNCPYILRQDSGDQNALGVIKFMFPNHYNVYIHDTPTKDLFSKEERAFSSGCIRVQNPLALAHHLLRDSQKWKPEVINQLVENKKEQTIMLPKPLNVHFLYLTSWAEQNGSLINFRKDVYERDEAVLKALKASIRAI